MPTGTSPPWPYSASSLNELHRTVTGPEFIQRVRRFSRLGILTIGTRFLWHTWNHDETITSDTPEAIGHRVTMAYAERVMMLAAIYATDHQRAEPNEVDFRLLCWELHNSYDGNLFDEAAAAELAQRLTKTDTDSPLRKLTTEHARVLLAEAFKARIAALQHIGRYFDRGDFARGYLIVRCLSARALTLGGAEYVRAEKQFLLSSVEGFFRASWALFTKAQLGLEIRDEHGQPVMTDYGHVYSRDWPSDPNLDALQISVDDLRAVASVLSEPLSSFPALRPNFKNASGATLKYDSALDRLSLRPMIEIEGKERCEHVAIPSPWRYVHAVPEVVLYDFVRQLQDRRTVLLAGKDAYSLRGEAFADYVKSVTKELPRLFDLDAGTELAGQERPDLVWVGTAHTVLVELKFSVKPNDDRILKDTSAAVVAWQRSAEAIQQGAGFVRRHGSYLRDHLAAQGPVILVLVSTDKVIDESIGFRAVAKAGRLLEGTELQAIATLTISEFERWVLLSDADALARETLTAWARLDPFAVSQDSGIVAPKAQRDLPHIEAAWKELFPFYAPKEK